MAICNLCKKDKRLVKAHVVPEPFWPSSESGTPKLLSNIEGAHPKRSPIGVYDEGILCETCDNSLGQLDQHAVERLLRSQARKALMDDHNCIGYQHEYACPETVRKFIASVAWRASISTHPFYSRVKLGPYQEMIGNALRDGTALDHSTHAVLGEFDNPIGGFLDPHWIRMDGVRVWLIYAGRFIFYQKELTRGAGLIRLTVFIFKPVGKS